VDIVCAAVAVEAIAADRWYCSALNLGSGTVQCAHGVLPVPAPATAELLRGAPVYSSGIPKELLTPTGAAILRALDVRFEPLPRITLSATGYGAGARDFPGSANVVRLVIGESADEAAGWPTSAPHLSAQMWGNDDNAADEGSDTITVLEANLDDMNPQLFSYVQQKLLSSGALDAFGVPVQMKKGRPGIVLTVLATPAHAELLARILLTETTTLGVRMRQEQRRILAREHVTVESCWGPIRVKLGRLRGEVVNCAPEFEDCRTIAEATGVPLKTVLQEALRLYLASPATDASPSGPPKSILS
jgi:pyridinium-3,5-bisthiocarboxylic acid mononucleotide nickel chelatase